MQCVRSTTWGAGLAILAVVGLLILPGQADDTAAVKDGVFIHISHGTDNPHRVLMALQMAELMSGSRDVLVYFDIAGVDYMTEDRPTIPMGYSAWGVRMLDEYLRQHYAD